jgi:biopolymer transport protein ExbD
MSTSRRARRMQRHHARRGDKNTALNMVSLMDIFTILVFFLLVSAANSDILPTPKNIKLPISSAQNSPRETLVIMVGDNRILLQGKKVTDIQSVINNNSLIIMPLFNELQIQARKKSTRAIKNNSKILNITIMGDREIPYILLKKIMLTCASARYSNISLAVNHDLVKKG